MRLAPNFTLQEFTRSSAAAEIGVHNDPTATALRNLHYLALWLQQLRDRLRQPILITSGYRTERVNSHVGGSPTSDHMSGLAADIRVPGVPLGVVVGAIRSAPFLMFDQLILYPGHLHVGLGIRRRGEVLDASNQP